MCSEARRANNQNRKVPLVNSQTQNTTVNNDHQFSSQPIASTQFFHNGTSEDENWTIENGVDESENEDVDVDEYFVERNNPSIALSKTRWIQKYNKHFWLDSQSDSGSRWLLMTHFNFSAKLTPKYSKSTKSKDFPFSLVIVSFFIVIDDEHLGVLQTHGNNYISSL